MQNVPRGTFRFCKIWRFAKNQLALYCSTWNTKNKEMAIKYPAQGTDRGPVFDDSGKFEFSEELRKLQGKNDTVGTYVLEKNGTPMYIGVATLQPIYKTITRHFQRHRDKKQGRWIATPSDAQKKDWTFGIIWADTPSEALETEAKLVLENRPEGNVLFNTGKITSEHKARFFRFAEPLNKVLKYETDGKESLDLSKPLPSGQFEKLYGRLRELDSYKEYLDSIGSEYAEAEKEEKRAIKKIERDLQEIEERDKNI